MKLKKLYLFSLIALLFGCLTSCSNNDEPKDENKTPNCSIKFKLDQNMINADEFTSQVSTVAVWAFNKAGDMVWSKTETAEKTFAKDYAMQAYLPEGEYDIVTWCGKTTDFFKLLPASLSSLSQLSLSLPLVDNNGTKVCNSELPVTFNGREKFTVTENPEQNSVTLSLLQATKNIRLNLQGKQTGINADDFDIYITDAANTLEWNLTPKSTESFEYLPYDVQTGNIMDGGTMSVVVADFTTLCLNTDSKATLVIKSKKTDNVVKSIPLVNYLLLSKEYETPDCSDQEYLDRQSHYHITLFVDQQQ